jgi:hypothetical protein
MRPGMSCNVEILVEDLQDVLFIPRQCVFFDGRETVVFQNQAGEITRRVVEVGPDNAQFVTLLAGLSQGDVVLLSPPPDFKPEGASPGAPEDGPRAESAAPEASGAAGRPTMGDASSAKGGLRDGYSGAGASNSGTPPAGGAAWGSSGTSSGSPSASGESGSSGHSQPSAGRSREGGAGSARGQRPSGGRPAGGRSGRSQPGGSKASGGAQGSSSGHSPSSGRPASGGRSGATPGKGGE